MSEQYNNKYKRYLAFSFIVGCALFLFSIFLGGGGHGYLVPFQLIFPMPALMGYFFGFEIFAFILCIVQFPIYITIINLRRYKMLWVLLSLLIIHFSSFALILYLDN